MSRDEILERLQALVSERAGRARTPADAGPDTPLGEGGYWLDSVDILELVVACEHEFSISFEGEADLTEESLGTVATLADLIASKRRSVA